MTLSLVHSEEKNNLELSDQLKKSVHLMELVQDDPELLNTSSTDCFGQPLVSDDPVLHSLRLFGHPDLAATKAVFKELTPPCAQMPAAST
jgi:hypothetical protein